MTKVEMLKARAYAIEILEDKTETFNDQIDCIKQENGEEMPQWAIDDIGKICRKIKWINAVIDEIAK